MINLIKLTTNLNSTKSRTTKIKDQEFRTHQGSPVEGKAIHCQPRNSTGGEDIGEERNRTAEGEELLGDLVLHKEDW